MSIDLNHYDYLLPDRLISLHPRQDRSSSRMLVSDKGPIIDSRVADIASFLNPGDLLLFNDTRVIPARINGQRMPRLNSSITVNVSATLLDEESPGIWSALVKPKRRLKDGDLVKFSKDGSKEEIAAIVRHNEQKSILLDFNLPKKKLLDLLMDIGNMPIPPYLEKVRGPSASDFSNYQTTFAKREGAVAAPTASLHFDQSSFETLKCNGINFSFVTLHVGAGTFLPVTREQLLKRKLHKEYGKVSKSVADQINKAKKNGKRVIAVGTTTLRLIESAVNSKGIVEEFDGATQLMISPGFSFKVCDKLLTNFHLPKSSLLMLVSTFHGHQRIKKIYEHAINNEYKFYSFGDCMLISMI